MDGRSDLRVKAGDDQAKNGWNTAQSAILTPMGRTMTGSNDVAPIEAVIFKRSLTG
jgi:hypothetical protein